MPAEGERLTVKQIINAVHDLGLAEGAKKHIKYLSSLPSRMDGYPGNKMAADYIAETFRQYGLTVVREPFNVTVPIDRGSFLEVSTAETSFRLEAKALWPNLVETCRTPKEGLRGELVYVGKGSLDEIEGMNLTGKIALMEFDSGENWWKNVVYLGARGIIFIEPLEYKHSEASLKYVNVPLDVPRVLISREDADRLLSLKGPVQIALHVNMDYEKNTSENIVAILNGTTAKDEVFMIVAHYDSFSYIPTDAPGAQESVGVSILMELARFFQTYKPKRTIWFVAFSGHNLQLAGARWFAYQHYLDLVRWKLPGYTSVAGIFDIGYINLESNANTIAAEGGFYGMLERFRAPHVGPMVNAYTKVEKIIEEEAGKFYPIYEVEMNRQADPLPLACNLWFIPLDMEPFIGHLGVPALAVVTASTGIHHGTPSDTYDRLDFTNLPSQIEFVTASIYLLDWLQFERGSTTGEGGPVTLPTSNPPPVDRIIDVLYVQVVEYNVTSDVYNNIEGNNTLIVIYDYSPYTQTLIIEKTNPDGRVMVPGLTWRIVGSNSYWYNHNEYEVNAFVDSPSEGPVEYATDRGRWGTMRLRNRFVLEGAIISISITVPVFKCASLIVSGTLVPDLTIPVAVRVINHLTQTDEYFFGWNYHFTPRPPGAIAAAGGEGGGGGGRAMGLTAFGLEQSWITRPLFIVYLPLNTPVDILMLGPIGLPSMIFNNLEEGGGGYFFTKPGESRIVPFSDYVGLSTIQDILAMRLRGLEESNMYIGYGKEAFMKSDEYLEGAQAALEKEDYLTLRADVLGALRPLSEAYGEIMRIIHESINTVTAFFPLIFISAFALEKIVINSRTLRSKLAWIIIIMTVLVAILFLIHPAYSLKLGFALNISVSMMVIAIIGIMLSAVPIAIVMRRMQITMARVRRAILGEHEVSISRAGFLFMLWSTGLENLRRRRLRTILTVITILIVTSSMVSLVSLEFKYVPKIYEEKEYAAPYNGLLIKERDLRTLPPHLVDFLKARYHGEATVIARATIYKDAVWGDIGFGHLRDLKGNAIGHTGLLGLMPEEKDLNHGLETAIIEGRWLRPGDEYVCLISKAMKEKLNVNVGDKIWIYSKVFTIIGIFDEKFIPKDIDDLTIFPYVIIMNEVRQCPPEGIVVVPYDTMIEDMQVVGIRSGGIESIAVKFNKPIDVFKEAASLTRNIPYQIHASMNGKVRLYARLVTGVVERITVLVVPMLLLLLTVINIMMAAVYERTKEIGVYSAVGLSPSHVSSMFFMESAAVGIVSAVLGYIVGVGMARILITMPAFSGIYPNFTSSWLLISITAIVGFTIASTIYPSMKASQIVTPSLVRRWRLSVAAEAGELTVSLPFVASRTEVGPMLAYVYEYLEAQIGETTGTFSLQDLNYEKAEERDVEVRRLVMTVKLAPYEAGISMEAQLNAILPLRGERISLELHCTRKTGETMDWRAGVRNFISALREQLLLWRTLPLTERNKYKKKSEEMGFE